MASTLVRYDGWFFFICLAVILLLWSWVTLGRKKAEGVFLLFISVGDLGILLWFLWNLTIFGDTLYFIHGPYSAFAQQKVLRSVGQLPTEGNIFTALVYYVWAVIDNNGLLLTVLAIAGAVISPFIIKSKQLAVLVLVLFSPFVFNVLALYLGQSAMNVPQAQVNPGLFNIRYGILMLPAIALVLGVLASYRRFVWVVIVILIFQSMLFIRQGKPIALVDGLNGLADTYYTVEASSWLAQNYDKGLILTSLASNDAFVARAKLPMRLYVHEGTREYWQNALEAPSKNVEYIATISYPPDSVYLALKNNQDFINNYVLVHSYGTFGIYKCK